MLAPQSQLPSVLSFAFSASRSFLASVWPGRPHLGRPRRESDKEEVTPDDFPRTGPFTPSLLPSFFQPLRSCVGVLPDSRPAASQGRLRARSAVAQPPPPPCVPPTHTSSSGGSWSSRTCHGAAQMVSLLSSDPSSGFPLLPASKIKICTVVYWARAACPVLC